jgi:hypothetical protein
MVQLDLPLVDGSPVAAQVASAQAVQVVEETQAQLVLQILAVVQVQVHRVPVAQVS